MRQSLSLLWYVGYSADFYNFRVLKYALQFIKSGHNAEHLDRLRPVVIAWLALTMVCDCLLTLSIVLPVSRSSVLIMLEAELGSFPALFLHAAFEIQSLHCLSSYEGDY